MNFNTKLSKEEVLSFYSDNKEYALPALSIVASFFLFFVFIVPQLISFPSKRQEANIENAKLERIKEAEKVLTGANVDILDSQIKIATKALPPGKAFEEILNGISSAVSLSNTQIESYQFDTQTILSTGSIASKFSTLLFEITIIGSTQEAIEFTKALYKTYPASEVTSILTSSGITSVKALFYYKSFSQVSPEERTQVRSISAKEKETLDEISKWNDTSAVIFFEPEVSATESAENDSSPF
ncbi:MAG: hypothetical protein HYW63_02880 [Candidatus Levybacteria bacterium]|nr:hypothetical protein [Candidatus Levybacteria bacterium]